MDTDEATTERFVDQHVAAEFLSLKPRRVLELARMGRIPAHPIGDGVRRVWRFRLSEISAALTRQPSIPESSFRAATVAGKPVAARFPRQGR
jgi:hypothetical protein